MFALFCESIYLVFTLHKYAIEYVGQKCIATHSFYLANGTGHYLSEVIECGVQFHFLGKLYFICLE